jgi:dTDP-4-amino-4,6-dideoxygalactose transaminase
MDAADTLRVLVPDLPVVDDYLDALRQIDARRWYTNGGVLCKQFEDALATLVAGASAPAQHCVTTSSGTAALEVALSCLNLPPRSRVLVPTYTFPATANAVVRTGHVPVLSDVCPRQWTLTPSMARAALERERIDAVMPVAVFGARLPVAAWDAFSATTGVPVLIDAAAALGAIEGGARVVVAYSLHATKPLGIGEGGVIASANADFATRARRMVNHGFQGGLVTVAGTNARLSEYAAAIGLAQLARWPRVLARRRALWNRYRALLADVPGVALQDGVDDDPPAVLTLRTSIGADALAASLATQCIETRRWYAPPLHAHPAYAHVPHAASAGAFEVAEDVARHAIGVPFHAHLTPDDVDRVVRTLAATLAVRERDATAAAGADERSAPAASAPPHSVVTRPA